mmetsp:Transcript_10303/g.23666  ORF Transcript_10303/g.23666 Transcript_10303/m.23666 type:complete len:126 (+) Transcript_10303:3-380(+)
MLLDMGDSSPPAPPPQAPQHILAPLQVTTQQVGQMWGSLASERKMQLQTSCANCQEVMSRLQNGANAHPVEIIGMEGIAAGRVQPGNDPCFLHSMLAPPRLDISVRTQDAAVAQRVLELCQRVLA